MALERVCPRCAYQTTRPVDRCPSCDVPLRHQERGWADARRAIRVSLPPGVQGDLNGQVAVTVLDLSPLGARLEHAEPLLPAQACLLTFALPEAVSLRVPASIVWSRAHLLEPTSGETRWLYHSGVEFREVPPTLARDLGAYLNRVAGGPGSLSGTVAIRVE